MLLKLPFFICGLYRLIHGEINAGKMAATERAVRSYSTKQIYGVNSNYKKKKKRKACPQPKFHGVIRTDFSHSVT